MTHKAKIESMVANIRKLEALRHQLAIDYGFAYKRPQNFKNCIVIRWKLRKRKSEDFIDYERIEECTCVKHMVCDHYDLWDSKHMLLDYDLMLAKVSIYCRREEHIWAIPNDKKKVQDYVLSKLPSWAKVTVKN